VALTAWKYFDLGPGISTGTVDGDFQVGVRVSNIVHGVDHTTAFAEANFGDTFHVAITDGIPKLSRTRASGDSIELVNGIRAPESSAIDVTLYRDYAPLLNRDVPPNGQESFAHPDGFYCYASMPFSGEEEALALESVVGHVSLLEPGNLRVQLIPLGSKVQWKVNGKVVDV